MLSVEGFIQVIDVVGITGVCSEQSVERVVEGNANVRTNLEEVEGGDEQRVWQWVGSAAKLSAPVGVAAADEKRP